MMSKRVAQRLDYTFKYNQKLGRHGWLRLTPAYSVKLVEELLANDYSSNLILDPFSGTATTGLVSAFSGRQSYLYEINPFLIWFGNAKCSNYSMTDIAEALSMAKQCTQQLSQGLHSDVWLPNIYNINRWWCSLTLNVISSLRRQLVLVCGEPDSSKSSDLVWIAFCRLIIETSSAAFNHVSMSFHDGVTSFGVPEISNLYLKILDVILESAIANPSGNTQVIHHDSRHCEPSDRLYDRVITSPPYPNRISYIRELRPYMYWTKFLTEAKQAGDLDWQAIGGTWGVATSRLASWTPTPITLPASLMEAVLKIRNSGGKNAFLMAQYVLKYFHDIYLHFSNLKTHLKKGATINYIVGNSSFYGVPVHSDRLYVDILESLGYTNVSSRIVRKRNSKKELFEYDVSAEAGM